jgi:small subunit ribosomal protein S9
MSDQILTYSGIGKRKTSIAKVFLKEGTGIIKVNNLPFEVAFVSLKEEREIIKNPLLLVKTPTPYDIDIKVKGGGMSSQLEAIQLGISKALCEIDQSYRTLLNQQLFLRRDSRIKERRKYGLKKARKASQYSKR